MGDPFPEKLAIQICSDSEWKRAKSLLKIETHGLSPQPFGEIMERLLEMMSQIRFHLFEAP